MNDKQALTHKIEKYLKTNQHPQKKYLIELLSGKTYTSSTGFPYISAETFSNFLSHVPHLFQDGLDILKIIKQTQSNPVELKLNSEEKLSLSRSSKVLTNIVNTAIVTAPSDLWVMAYILATHKQIGTFQALINGENINTKNYSQNKKLDYNFLETDFKFLYSRGYLVKNGSNYSLSSDKKVHETFKNFKLYKESYYTTDWAPVIRDAISTRKYDSEVINFLTLTTVKKKSSNWLAGLYDIDISFRLVPTIMALRNLNLTEQLKESVSINQLLPQFPKEALSLLEAAGLLNSDFTVSPLGERCFQRAPGPYGIVYAYHSYMKHHKDLLYSKDVTSWVSRGANIAASQDANKKTFKLANNALDQFQKKYNFQYDVYIEHAVGQGEATRQRWEANKNAPIHYFGADLEDAAIDRAIEIQKKGNLPPSMQFIRNADIGKPNIVIEYLKKNNIKTEGAVMIVGNGFHEARNQSNESMIEVFRQYSKAGIVLLFTEESGLSDEDLLATAWNTYHAGFRYVHEISRQGLRPAIDHPSITKYSWSKCATLGDYTVLEEFTTRTRTIYPHPKKDGNNPAISVSYFCVPQNLMNALVKAKR